MKPIWTFLFCLASIAGAPAAAAAAEARPYGLPLLLEESFEKGAGRWEPGDAAAWKVIRTEKGSAYSLFQQSQYQPPHRSPVNIALLKAPQLGDFVLDADVLSTCKDYDHRDMCLVFGYQDPRHFYYVHFGKKTDDHANQIFIVNDAPRIKISARTTPGTAWTDGWHRVRIVRRLTGGRIEVYFGDMENPVMTAADRTFTWGRIGIGSFDDTGNFTGIRIWGRESAGAAGAGKPLDQLPAADRETAAFIARHLDPASGGFGPEPGKPADLGTSLVGLRAARYIGAPDLGGKLDLARLQRFIASCADRAAGSFADAPGGKPSVHATAFGWMAADDAGLPLQEYTGAGIAYLTANAQGFEDIRIAAAAFDLLGKDQPRAEKWIAEIGKLRNADGVFGSGPDAARETGGAVAALLRLEAPFDRRDAAVQAILSGQRPDGGFGRGEGPSDLESCYRVTRCCFMLGERPDLARLRSFVDGCRNADGGYGLKKGEASGIRPTYYASIIRHWARELMRSWERSSQD